MVNSTTFRRLALLGRIKSMRFRMAAQQGAKQIAIIAFAVLLALGGIGFLMFCLFTVLASEFGIFEGALSSGLLLLAFAAMALIAATRLKQPSEAQALENLEKMVTNEIAADLKDVESGFRRFESGASALFKGDYLSALANFAGSLR